MKIKQWTAVAGFVITFVLCLAGPASAQNSGPQEKPRMYTYVALWDLPRAQWPEWSKSVADDQKAMQDAVAKGWVIGYGDDSNLVHQPDQPTHDTWFSSMSMAGLMNTLDGFYKSGSTQTPIDQSAKKHWDNVYVSRYYNWHGGSWQGLYSYGSSYKLKEHAPDDALDVLAKNAIVPIMEKMLADGTIHEYEIDTEAVHTDAPGTFWIFYIGANADALDKVNGAIREAVKSNPLIGSGFGEMVSFKEHRDILARTNATYK